MTWTPGHVIPERAWTPAEKRELLDRLLELWLRVPLQRLGQLLVNATTDEANLGTVEDKALLSWVALFTSRYDDKNPSAGVPLERLSVEWLKRDVDRISGWLRTSEAERDEERLYRKAMEIRAFAAEKARDEAQAQLARVDGAICWGTDCIHKAEALDISTQRFFPLEEERDKLRADLAALQATMAAFCANASVCMISDCKQHPHDWRTLAAALPASMLPPEDDPENEAP